MKSYLYKATGVTLAVTYLTLIVTTNALLRLVLGSATDLATRQTIALGLGLLVVTTPIWWLQWRWLRWQLTEAIPAAQHDFRTYLLTVTVIALFVTFGSAGMGVVILTRLALGILVDSTLGWVQSLTAVTAMIVAAAIWSLHWGYVRDKRTGWDVAHQ